MVLRERGRLKEWSRTSEAVTSEITRVECLRALDSPRPRQVASRRRMVDRELARRRATALSVLSGFELVRLNRAVLERAAEPFPVTVRTLDALHVASALLVRGRFPALRFATHDLNLGATAQAEGLPVIGVLIGSIARNVERLRECRQAAR